MSYRRVFQIALVVLTGVLVACSGDTVTPTSPELAGFGTLTGEAKPQSGTFTVGPVTGDVTFDKTKLSNPAKLDGTQVVALGVPLNLSFFKTAITGGGFCFGGAINNGALAIGLVKKNDPTNLKASHFFSALGKDGTEITYHLQMFGIVTGNWLPSNVKDKSIITLFSWEMKFDTKGGKKQACTGSGDFDNPVKIDVTRFS